MTDIDSLAAALFGTRRAETQEVLTDATTRTYTGTAVTDSEDGTVIVDLGGDVTLPDDIEGLAEYSADGVEVATGPGVRAGDEVVVTLVGGTPLKTPMVTGVAGEGDRQDERIHAIEADYVKASTLEADVADIGFLKADSATIKDMQADTAKVHDLTADQLSAATAYIATLTANSVTAASLTADVAKVHDLTADQLSAAAAYIAQLSADSVTAQRIAAISGDFDTVRANAAKVANLTAAELEADHATIGSLDANYAKITNGHIDSALIDTAAIVDEQVFTVTGNKATLAQIDASKINVLNLKAKDIEVERINGQPVTNKTLVDALSQHESDISGLDTKIDNEVEALNDRIDGAIETFTGTVAPTLSNAPASSWNTAKLKDQHVGDVYYVVNSQSAQNGYCYRFTKSGSTYSWQLIKDSDVTAALSRLQTAEGKIGNIEQFDETVGSFMTDTDDEISSLKTRTTSLETSIGDKVDTSTFNTVSQKVDANEANITSMSTVLTNNGLTSSTNITNTVNTVRQTAETNTSNISSLQTTVSGHTTTISQHTTAIQQNADAIALRATKTEVQQVRPAYASSSTAAGTAAKVATIDPAVTGYALYKGASVAVTFSTANTAATPTLNLNSTGAKQIRSYTGAALSEGEYKWAAGATIDLVYDGTYWRMQDGGSVKRVTAAEASIKVNADNIESKVSKDGVISSINQSAETVKIDASKVEIDGTAVFNAISSDVDDAITGKGYQTSSQVESAITSKGYQTASQVSAAVTNGTANLAPKANAVKRTQRIWYRTNASSAPATPGTASSNWVTKADDGNDAWTKMHIAINSTHKYIYTCEQYEMANGTVGYTSVLLDNTITVIDGGNIITGTVTANKLNAANINASKTLTVGAMTDAAASTILNSNVVVGGRNLLLATDASQSKTMPAIAAGSYTTWDPYTMIGAYSTLGLTTSDSITVSFDWSVTGAAAGATVKIGTNASPWEYFGVLITFASGASSGHVEKTFAVTSTLASATGTTLRARIDAVGNAITTSMVLTISNAKLEKGNKATDWTPAPEDMATAESLAGTNESLDGAIADIGELSDQLVGTVTEQNKTITTIQTYLNSLRKDLDAEIQSRQQWLNFNSAEGLVIGAKNSTFKTVTTNTSQQFKNGGTVLAETSGTEFVAPVMRSDQLLIGNWMWTRRDNGNLSLKWIG